MKKIYLIIAGAFLILLIIILTLISLGKKQTVDTNKNSAFPTSVPLPETTRQNNQIPTDAENPAQEIIAEDITAIAPVETKDFKLQYSPKLKKIVVERNSVQAMEKFNEWVKQNNHPELIDNPELTLFVDKGKNPDDFNPIIDFLNIFMNMGQGISLSSINQAPLSDNSSTNSTPTSTDASTKVGFTYFAQCGDQGNLPLPNGGTLCSAGCGPTSVAMIASSYLGKQYDPKAIINLYKSSNYLLSNDGSRYSDAHELIKQLGLKTTDYLVFNEEKSDTVVPQLRKYLSAGWTFFTLASFCEKGCGHYFWITDIDNQGNIFAYDPAYGRYQIPYNENTRYPYPLYRLAFGVKK